MLNRYDLFMKKLLFFSLFLAHSLFCTTKNSPIANSDTCSDKPQKGPFSFYKPEDLKLSCSRGFSFFVDFLFMQPQEEGLDYAYRNMNPGSGLINNGSIVGFNTDEHHWKWDYGFRFAVNYQVHEDLWDLRFQWLWFKINEEVSESALSNSIFVPLWLTSEINALNGGQAHASARWHLLMNVFDLTLEKSFMISHYLTWQPFFGFRGAWIDQTYLARYSGRFYGAVQEGVIMQAQNDSWGAGSRAGFNAKWLLGANIYLLTNLNASLLVSKLDVEQEALAESRSFSFENVFHQLLPNAELQLGISWKTYFNQRRNFLNLQVLYEYHHWWNQNAMRKVFATGSIVPNETVSRGDLILNGFSFRTLFAF